MGLASFRGSARLVSVLTCGLPGEAGKRCSDVVAAIAMLRSADGTVSNGLRPIARGVSGGSPRLVPRCFRVPDGRQAEHPAILPSELRDALVADCERGAARG